MADIILKDVHCTQCGGDLNADYTCVACGARHGLRIEVAPAPAKETCIACPCNFYPLMGCECSCHNGQCGCGSPAVPGEEWCEECLEEVKRGEC